MKKWFIALLFVFACLPVVAVKAAPPQSYIHLEYEVISGGYYNIGDGNFETGHVGWRYSNKIQIPKNVDKLYFSGWLTHFMLFFDDKTYIGHYYDGEFVSDLTWEAAAEEMILGVYFAYDGLTQEIDMPTNATHIVLQSCIDPSVAGLEDYIDPALFEFEENVKPLIYYPAPADAAANLTFNLMPALMIMIVIAGAVGSLILITKKSKR